MEVGGQLYAPAALPTVKKRGAHWIRGWVGRWTGLDVEKRHTYHPSLGPSSRYSDCAIPSAGVTELTFVQNYRASFFNTSLAWSDFCTVSWAPVGRSPNKVQGWWRENTVPGIKLRPSSHTSFLAVMFSNIMAEERSEKCCKWLEFLCSSCICPSFKELFCGSGGSYY